MALAKMLKFWPTIQHACNDNVCLVHNLNLRDTHHMHCKPLSQIWSSLSLQCYGCFMLLLLLVKTGVIVSDAVEHAAWTKGSRYMQPLRDDLSWFQTNSLDVLAFLGCMALIVLSVAGVVFFILVRKGLQLLQRYGLLFHSKSA